MIQVKRVYDTDEPGGGRRLLVERLWPRGVRKDGLNLDGWLEDVAPSTELRRWFGHDPARVDEFRRRYFAELDQKPDVWKPILEEARQRTVTLLYSAHDTRHNNAVALKEYLEKHQIEGNQPTHRDELPVKVYRSQDRLMVAAPMPGLEPEDIAVEITPDEQLILRCDRRAGFKGERDVLLDEWRVGGYVRKLRLPCPVDGGSANVTYGNGVLVVALPIAGRTQPALVRLDVIGEARGEHAGNQGHPVRAISNVEHRAAAHPRAVGRYLPQWAVPEIRTAGAKRPLNGWDFDVVQEASEESFPASDAPSWVAGPPD